MNATYFICLGAGQAPGNWPTARWERGSQRRPTVGQQGLQVAVHTGLRKDCTHLGIYLRQQWTSCCCCCYTPLQVLYRLLNSNSVPNNTLYAIIAIARWALQRLAKGFTHVSSSHCHTTAGKQQMVTFLLSWFHRQGHWYTSIHLKPHN